MLDLILEGRVYTFGYIYDDWKGMQWTLQVLMSKKSKDYASYYKSNKKWGKTVAVGPEIVREGYGRKLTQQEFVLMIRDDPDACVEAALHWEGLRQIEDSMKMSQRKPAHKARIIAPPTNKSLPELVSCS